MDNKKIFLSSIIFSIIFLILLGSAFLIGWEGIRAAPVEQLEICKTIQYNGKDKQSIVFFSDEDTAKEYSELLFGLSPLNNYRDFFNVFYIDSYTTKCSLYKGIAVFCYSRGLIEKAASCPNDYIVVINSEHKPEIRSSSYKNVVSLNEKHPKKGVFAHEFGHVFANLADEYVPAKLPGKQKNCVSQCDNFVGEIEGCFQGCAKESYYRSVENGVMRTLGGASYGKYNEDIIKSRIKISGEITGRTIEEFETCDEERYHLIEFSYNSEGIREIEREIKRGCIGVEPNGYGEFEYRIYDNLENIIYEGNFNPGFVFTESETDGGAFDYEGNFVLRVPVVLGDSRLEIEYPDGNIFQINMENAGERACRV